MGSMDENAPPAEAAPVGVAKIVCTLLEGRSVLSTVAHRQPVRVQPLPSALSAAAGAACAVLSYAANAAPMLDAIHCCHAQLDMRLFQT